MPSSPFSAPYEHLRERLIAARKDAGWTQVELAYRLKRPQSFVSKYERGERRLDVVEFIEVVMAIGANAGAILGAVEKEVRRFLKKKGSAPRSVDS
jgi:transcriptional regulator with XRE-family HTH domain